MKLPANCSLFWTFGPAVTVCLCVLIALAIFSSHFDEGEVMVAVTSFGATLTTCEGVRRNAVTERKVRELRCAEESQGDG